MLLTLPNPKYNEINKYGHLGGIQMHDTDIKNLCANSYYIGVEDFAIKKNGILLE